MIIFQVDISSMPEFEPSPQFFAMHCLPVLSLCPPLNVKYFFFLNKLITNVYIFVQFVEQPLIADWKFSFKRA